MELRAGTSGFSYKAWKGPFYPQDLPATKMLEYYSRRLPAVEINNTFYRLPRVSVLESWAGAVPETFRFAIKASRRITHFKRLLEASEETGYLLEATAALGSRLGAILFQLPPNFPRDLERLDAFLGVLPEGTPAAFEFRHDSWDHPEVRRRLKDRGLALCVADVEGKSPPRLETSTAWGYLRLRRSDYDDQALADWARLIREAGWVHGFVFFKHEDEGAAPRMARRFLELSGATS